MKLHNSSRNLLVAEKVIPARSFFARSKGLLGLKSFTAGHALWIHQTNSIHTWFMKFPIDAIFVNRQLVVVAVYRHLKPWRITWPALRAHSVFELPAGTLDVNTVNKGDQLYVGN